MRSVSVSIACEVTCVTTTLSSVVLRAVLKVAHAETEYWLLDTVPVGELLRGLTPKDCVLKYERRLRYHVCCLSFWF